MSREHEPVLVAIHVLSSRITRAFEARLDSQHGLSVAEWRVLLSLARRSGMAVSRAVRRLESQGHVRRKRKPSDGRSFVLEITAKGTRLFRKILPSADARYREILSGLTARERRSLGKILEKLIEHTGRL